MEVEGGSVARMPSTYQLFSTVWVALNQQFVVSPTIFPALGLALTWIHGKALYPAAIVAIVELQKSVALDVEFARISAVLGRVDDPPVQSTGQNTVTPSRDAYEKEDVEPVERPSISGTSTLLIH